MEDTYSVETETQEILQQIDLLKDALNRHCLAYRGVQNAWQKSKEQLNDIVSSFENHIVNDTFHLPKVPKEFQESYLRGPLSEAYFLGFIDNQLENLNRVKYTMRVATESKSCSPEDKDRSIQDIASQTFAQIFDKIMHLEACRKQTIQRGREQAEEGKASLALGLVKELIGTTQSKVARHDHRKDPDDAESTTLNILEVLQKMLDEEDSDGDREKEDDPDSIPTSSVPQDPLVSPHSAFRSSITTPNTTPITQEENDRRQRGKETTNLEVSEEPQIFRFKFLCEHLGASGIGCFTCGGAASGNHVGQWQECIVIDPTVQKFAPHRDEKTGVLMFVHGRIDSDSIGKLYPILVTSMDLTAEYIGHYRIGDTIVMPLDTWKSFDEEDKLSVAREIDESAWGRELLQQKFLSINYTDAQDKRLHDILEYFKKEEEPHLRMGATMLDFSHFDFNGRKPLEKAFYQLQQNEYLGRDCALPQDITTLVSSSTHALTIPARRSISPMAHNSAALLPTENGRRTDIRNETYSHAENTRQTDFESAFEPRLESMERPINIADNQKSKIIILKIGKRLTRSDSPDNSFERHSRSSSTHWRHPSLPLVGNTIVNESGTTRDDIYDVSPRLSERTLATNAMAPLARAYHMSPQDVRQASPASKKQKLRHDLTPVNSQSSSKSSNARSVSR